MRKFLVGGLVAILYFPIYWEESSQLTKFPSKKPSRFGSPPFFKASVDGSTADWCTRGNAARRMGPPVEFCYPIFGWEKVEFMSRYVKSGWIFVSALSILDAWMVDMLVSSSNFLQSSLYRYHSAFGRRWSWIRLNQRNLGIQPTKMRFIQPMRSDFTNKT